MTLCITLPGIVRTETVNTRLCTNQEKKKNINSIFINKILTKRNKTYSYIFSNNRFLRTIFFLHKGD